MNSIIGYRKDAKDTLTVPLRSASLYSAKHQLQYPELFKSVVPVQYVNNSTGTVYDTVDRGNTWYLLGGLVDNWLPESMFQPRVSYISTKKHNKKPSQSAPIQKKPQHRQVFVYAPYSVPTELTHSTNTSTF